MIEGQISNLSIHSANVHFLKTIKREQKIAGAVAVVQAMAGQAGAVFSAQAAMDEGDPVESFSMELAGEKVAGSFWKASFKDGEKLKAIGTRISGAFRATAIVDTKNQMIWMTAVWKFGCRVSLCVKGS